MWKWENKECSKDLVEGPATATKTAVTKMMVFNGYVTLHPYARPGIWYMCHKLKVGLSLTLIGIWYVCHKLKLDVWGSVQRLTLNLTLTPTLKVGVWTLVHQSFDITTGTARQAILIIVAQPSFTPPAAITGALTPLTFAPEGFYDAETGLVQPSYELPQVAPGDYVVLQEFSCSNAHLAYLSTSSLPPTQVNNDSVVYTNVNMTPATKLKVCVASGQTSANSADDFVEIALELTQVLLTAHLSPSLPGPLSIALRVPGESPRLCSGTHHHRSCPGHYSAAKLHPALPPQRPDRLDSG